MQYYKTVLKNWYTILFVILYCYTILYLFVIWYTILYLFVTILINNGKHFETHKVLNIQVGGVNCMPLGKNQQSRGQTSLRKEEKSKKEKQVSIFLVLMIYLELTRAERNKSILNK